MKITDTLDHLLRLLLTTDEDGQVNEEASPASEPKRTTEATGRGSQRTLPEWVRRANERILAAQGAPASTPQRAPDQPAVSSHAGAEQPEVPPDVPTEVEPVEPVLRSVEARAPEPHLEPVVVVAEPALEVVAEPDHEPEPIPVLVVAAAAEPDPGSQALPEADPAPADVEVLAADFGDTDVGTVLVPVDQDLAHLETAARVAESLGLGFHLGSAVERIASAANQGSEGVPALREAAWLIERYVAILEERPIGADLHLSAARLARAGDAIAGLRALAEALDADAAPASTEATPDTLPTRR